MLLYFILLCFVKEGYQEINYEPEWTSDLVAERLLAIMRTYCEETKGRVGAMNGIRSYYDESPQFEMGYAVAEILEKYRKIILSIKSPYEKSQRSDNLAYVIKRCEYVQKLFFEIYELGNMIHEIENKWKITLLLEKEPIFEAGGEEDRQARIQEIHKSIERARLARLKEMHKRKRQRKQKKGFDSIAIRFQKKDNRPVNKWWDLDYGWEIDYYW